MIIVDTHQVKIIRKIGKASFLPFFLFSRYGTKDTGTVLLATNVYFVFKKSLITYTMLDPESSLSITKVR